jgi:hypothetical protein
MKMIKILSIFLLAILAINFASALTINDLYWVTPQGNENTQTIDITPSDSVAIHFSSFGILPNYDYPIKVSLGISEPDSHHNFNYLIHNNIVLNEAEFNQAIDGDITINPSLYSQEGNYEITLSSEDATGDLGVEKTLYLNVVGNSPNVELYLNNIEDQTINEENLPLTIGLVSTYNGNNNLDYSIQSTTCPSTVDASIQNNNQLVISEALEISNDVTCQIEVKVDEASGTLSDTESFELIIIAQQPYLVFNEIPTQYLNSNEAGQIDLNNYVDYHGDFSNLEFLWQIPGLDYEGSVNENGIFNYNVSVDSDRMHTVSVTAREINGNLLESVTFILSITYVEPTQLSIDEIPAQTINSAENNQLDLSEYINYNEDFSNLRFRVQAPLGLQSFEGNVNSQGILNYRVMVQENTNTQITIIAEEITGELRAIQNFDLNIYVEPVHLEFKPIPSQHAYSGINTQLNLINFINYTGNINNLEFEVIAPHGLPSFEGTVNQNGVLFYRVQVDEDTTANISVNVREVNGNLEATQQFQLNIEYVPTHYLSILPIRTQVVNSGETARLDLTNYIEYWNGFENLEFEITNNQNYPSLEYDFVNGVMYYRIRSEEDTRVSLDLRVTEINGHSPLQATTSFDVYVNANSIPNPDNELQFRNDYSNVNMMTNQQVINGNVGSQTLLGNTEYTDNNGNRLPKESLLYSIVENTCRNTRVYLEQDDNEWIVESGDSPEICSFRIRVDETNLAVNEPQFDISNPISVIVTESATPRQLIITDVNCTLEQVASGAEQYCRVRVEDEFGQSVNDASVSIFYEGSNNAILNNDDGFNGYYSFRFNAKEYSYTSPNTYTVYANARHPQLAAHTSHEPNFDFTVFERTFGIENFNIYDDSVNFGNPLEDTSVFHRGDEMYVEFQVVNLETQELITDEDLMTRVTLFARDTAYNRQFELISFNESGQNYYRYRLQGNTIPLNDYYLGENFAIAFVSDAGRVGQEERTITILNNLPTWSSNFSDLTLNPSSSITIPQLSARLADLEDDHYNRILSVFASSSAPSVNVRIERDTLVIEGAHSGVATILLTGVDSNNGRALTTFRVHVTGEPGDIEAEFNYGPNLPKIQEQITFDAGNSFGADLDYSWNFGDGTEIGFVTVEQPEQNEFNYSQDQERTTDNSNDKEIIRVSRRNQIVKHSYGKAGYYTVTLTVRDMYGNTDTYTQVINVDSRKACSDGIDNDNDGLVDMEDPGCESPNDDDEYNVGLDIEGGIVVEYINVQGTYEDVLPGEDIQITAKVRNTNDVDVENLRLSVSSLDFGEHVKSSSFDLDAGDSKVISLYYFVPYEMMPGEYPLRVSISNNEVIRTKYRFVNVI